MHCRVDLFNTDILLNMLDKMGFIVYDRMEADFTAAIDKPWFNTPQKLLSMDIEQLINTINYQPH